MYYRHRQWGSLGLLISVVLGALAIIGILNIAGAGVSATLPVSIFVVVLALVVVFSTLTVEVTDTQLRLWFGLRVVRRSFPISDIVGTAVVRNRWWYGWGIRLTPHGWLFNVSGLDAVEIALRDGRHYRIGTDEPHELLNAIDGARGGGPGSGGDAA